MTKIVDKNRFLAAHLIDWYRDNQRNLPWRNTKSPYKIWLSEIILQQTRVNQGLAYYKKFISIYPTIGDLAKAPEDEVMKNWQGLGYYSRARNLHHTAKYIHDNLKGKFPENHSEIKSLKGIGDYTAAAIASFAFDQAYAVLDGNVFRILSRYYGIADPIDQNSGKKIFQKKANDLINEEHPAEHNQAIMEFAAIQCVPKNPNCNKCPLKEKCFAYQKEMVDALPVKAKKIKQKKRYFNYFIISENGKTLIKRRNESGIWQNLYDFPLVESSTMMDFDNLVKSEDFNNLFQNQEVELLSKSKPYKHLLTHQKIFAQFYHIKVTNFAQLKINNATAIEEKDLVNYPIPKLVENYLQEETNLLSLFGI